MFIALLNIPGFDEKNVSICLKNTNILYSCVVINTQNIAEFN